MVPATFPVLGPSHLGTLRDEEQIIDERRQHYQALSDGERPMITKSSRAHATR
jgi:hypothetical protein